MAPASLNIQQKSKHCLIFAGLWEGYGPPEDTPALNVMYIIPQVVKYSEY